MKISVLIIFVSAVISVSLCNAQTVRAFGLKAGTVSANQSWNWSPETGVVAASKSRQGLYAGLFVEWLSVPYISIITELDYIQKGSNVSTNIPVTTMQYPDGIGQYYSYSTRINYFSIPVLLKLRLDGNLFTPYILAGPRFDFKLSDDSSPAGYGASYKYKSNDFGGTVGLGLESERILPIHIGAEIRFSPSFQYCYSVRNLSVKNSALELALILSY